MVLIFVLYALCACTFTIAKATLAIASPIFYIGFRMTLAGALLMAVARISGSWKSIAKRDWLLIGQIALFAVFGAYVGDLWSLQYITSIESSLIFNLSPFIAALLSYCWFGECMTRIKFLGLCCGVASLIPHILTETQTGYLFEWERMVPIIVLVAAVFMASYGWIVTRELVKNRSFPSLQINGIGMFFGGALALALSSAVEGKIFSVVSDWEAFLLLTGAMIIIANGLFVNLYSYLLKKYTATLLSFAGGICPLFVALLGWLFLGEPITWRFIVSAALVFTGLCLFYKEELKQGYVA